MRENIKRRMRLFLREEDGPTASEYAVMMALVLLVLIGTVKALGTKVNSNFQDASQGW